ncbi:glycosyltransferase family 4 protein [Desulfobaculum sp. SPO524]|uniref:glycosyltransferase family 4 protein n=1 Tax=Desulfobaculum sp. SPO524 TaxID=3378071 RepID=UPI003854865F
MSARIAVMLPKLSSYGGAEGFSLRLATTLAQRGYAVDFICARQEVPAPEGVTPVIVGRPPLTRACKIAWYAYAAERARTRRGYDLSFSMGKTIAQDVLRMSGGPLSVFWRLSQRAWEAGFPRTWKMARRRLAPANALIRQLESTALQNQRVCVTVSHRVRDWLIEAHPELSQRDLRIIYNKPDLSRFSAPTDDERAALREEYGLAPQDVAISFAGTNFALKGLGTLTRALSMLPPHFKLFVAGGRNPGRFGALAESLGVAERIHFLGRVEDMPGLYRASDIFCLPSFYDTCSNAVLEALASGARVISTRDNGSSFFLTEDRILEDSADHEGLAAMLQTAADSPRPDAFVWPEAVKAGLPPYLDLVDELLA